MGKIGRSWELVKQSFAILRSDKELMLLPIASAISCLLVSAVILGGGWLAIAPQVASATAANAEWQPSAPLVIIGLFLLYLANYSVIVFFNVALVGIAANRLGRGAWTLRDGLNLAWERKGKVLQWAFLAATVGIILRMLEERMGWVGRLVVRLIGVAWTLACYFVVPVLAFEDLAPVDALKRSARLFRDNWGEQVVGGFSFGLIFLLLALPGFGIWLLGMMVAGATGFAVGGVLMVLYFLLLSVVSSATQGIFMAALYRYASTQQVAPGFRLENFSMAWHPK